MKYIKTYNEAIGPKLTRKEFVGDEETGSTQSVPSTGLSPAVFRSASGVANRSNQPNKGAILADYADEKEYGYYNLTVLRNRTGYLIKDVKATDVKIPDSVSLVIANSLTPSPKLLTLGTRYNKRVVECRFAVAIMALKLKLCSTYLECPFTTFQ